jgi:translation initiation factor 2B subunit (eIF-2B alpha/beta/delta family)
MEIDPLIRELSTDRSSGTVELVEKGAKTIIAFAGGWPAETAADLQDGLARLGRRILEARPSLAPLFHLVTELYARAGEPVDPMMLRRIIRTAAVEFNSGFGKRMEKVANAGAELLEKGARVMTFGRSRTVERTLLLGVERRTLKGAVIAECRPECHGRSLVAELAERGGRKLHLVPDLSLTAYLDAVDMLIFGADCIRGEGAVVPAGTAAAVTAARAAGKPAYLLAGILKILPGEATLPDPMVKGDPSDLWADPPRGVNVEYLPAEIAPLKLFKRILLESGPVEPFDLEQRVKATPVPPWL